MPQVKAGLAGSPTCWVVFVQDNQLIHQCLSVIRVQPVNPFQFLHGLIRAIESSLGLVQKRLASMWNVRVGVSDPSCPEQGSGADQQCGDEGLHDRPCPFRIAGAIASAPMSAMRRLEESGASSGRHDATTQSTSSSASVPRVPSTMPPISDSTK